MTADIAWNRSSPSDVKESLYKKNSSDTKTNEKSGESWEVHLGLLSLHPSDVKLNIPDKKPSKRDPQINGMLSGFYLVAEKEKPRGTEFAKSDSGREGEQSKDGGEKKSDAARKPIDISRLAAVGKEILHRIDPENKGVTKEQLAKAIQDPSYKGEQAQALAAMYDNFEQLSRIREPEAVGDLYHQLESKVLDRKVLPLKTEDLDAFEKIRPEQEKAIDDARLMAKWTHDNLKTYGRDGALSRSDIASALDRKDISAEDRRALTLLQSKFDDLAHGRDSLKESDLEAHADRVGDKHSPSGLVFRMEEICRRTAKEAQAGKEPFGLYSGTNPLDSIKPDAVRQGTIGDCYFDAALASVANTHPEMIRDAIKQNPDGTYTVTFPGVPGHPVTVKPPTEAELGLYNGASAGRGIWPIVMEKAFGELRKENPDLSFSGDKDAPILPTQGGTPEDSADGGGAGAPALELLTGHSNDVTDTKDSSVSEMADKFKKAFATGQLKAVTAEVKGDVMSLFGGPQTSQDGFIKQHMYSVTGYIPDGAGGPFVVVRNPWGGKDGTVYGTIKIPLQEFMKNFDVVSIET